MKWWIEKNEYCIVLADVLRHPNGLLGESSNFSVLIDESELLNKLSNIDLTNVGQVFVAEREKLSNERIVELANFINDRSFGNAKLKLSGEILESKLFEKDSLFDMYEKFDNPSNVIVEVSDFWERCGGFHGSSHYSMKAIKDIENFIEMSVNDINQSDLSNMEKILSCYLIAEKLSYIAANPRGRGGCSTYDSFTKDDFHMVCRDYARVFAKLLDKLGFNYKNILISYIDSKHAANLVEVNDEKYNINGNFLFDVTKDAGYYNCFYPAKNKDAIYYGAAMIGFGIGLDGMKYIEYDSKIEKITELENKTNLDLSIISKKTIPVEDKALALYNVNSFIYGNVDKELFKTTLAHVLYQWEHADKIFEGTKPIPFAESYDKFAEESENILKSTGIKK